MYLPTQAEPIERTIATEKQADTDGIEPQFDCYCMGGPPTTWHCDIGRSLWDTQVQCTA